MVTVQEFLAGLGSHRDWAMVLAMLLGDVDQLRDPAVTQDTPTVDRAERHRAPIS
jgi:hypothetical protein